MSKIAITSADDSEATIGYESTLEALAETVDGESTLGLSDHVQEVYARSAISLGPVLGKGGMGVVYLGNQALPERQVAVKRSNQSVRRLDSLLLHEALITGMLEHPNIVPIHEIRRSEDHQVEVVMKRIQGVTLREFICHNRGEKGYLESCLHTLIQTCNALAFSHVRGVIHRDIKPENIMIGEFGEVYLLDWGIAVKRDQPDRSTQHIVGTPAFMAPEMLTGSLGDIGPHTDVYLLGATLHMVLTGSAKHVGKREELLLHIEESKPYQYPPEISPLLAQIANRASHRDPERRFQSISELRDELQNYLDHQHTLELLRSAREEMQIALQLLEQSRQSSQSDLDRTKLYHHIHRARFGFERVMVINPQLAEARECLQALIDRLVKTLIDEGSEEAAIWFAESSGMLSDSMKRELDQVIERRQRREAEAERLQTLGRQHDPKTSQFARFLLVVGLSVSTLMVLYSLFYTRFFKFTMTSQYLFHGSFLLLLPVLIVFIVGRERLIFDSVGRRASIGILGGAIGVILHRWASVEFHIDPEVTLTTEKFVIAVAFANTPPALPSGMKIAVTCMLAAVVSVLFPHLRLTASLVFISILVLLLIRDFKREWRG